MKRYVYPRQRAGSHYCHCIRALLGAVGIVLAVLTAIRPAVAGAARTGLLDITVTNQTVGSAPATGTDVILHTTINGVQLSDQSSKTNAAGIAHFVELDTTPLAHYIASVDFDQVTYESPVITFAPPEVTLHVPLTVWQSTREDPGLTVKTAAIVLSVPDAATQSIGALELWTVVNPSKRAYVPTMQGSAGPMGLMRFALPPRSSAVQPQKGLDPTQLIQIEAGFASASPIPPGEQELVFSYRFPYATGSYDLARVFTYATHDFRLLVPTGALMVQAPDFLPSGVTTLGSRQYAVWMHQDAPAGTRTSVHLAGLPMRSPLQKLSAAWPRDGLPAATVLGAAVLAACIPLAYTAVATRRPFLVSQPADHSALVKEIADLDDRFALGGIAASDYQAARAALLCRAAKSATIARTRS